LADAPPSQSATAAYGAALLTWAGQTNTTLNTEPIEESDRSFPHKQTKFSIRTKQLT